MLVWSRRLVLALRRLGQPASSSYSYKNIGVVLLPSLSSSTVSRYVARSIVCGQNFCTKDSQSLLSSSSSTKKNQGTTRTMATTTVDTEKFKEQSELARKIFLAAVHSVMPSELVRSKVSVDGNILRIDGKQEISLDEFKNCYVVGFGKAVLPMAEQVVSMLGSRCNTCNISVPEGTRESSLPNIEVYRGAKNNIPDDNAALAARKILELVQSCQSEDLLIVLISGGGSALLPVPRHPITIAEKSNIIKRLSTAGATINELNRVRKQLSLVKGGGLVEQCPAKKIISLILSDVLGDPLDVIASGPTVPLNDDDSVTETPLKIVQKYIPNYINDISPSIVKVLVDNESSSSPVVKSTQSSLTTKSIVQNFIIGNNKLALTAALQSVDHVTENYVSCILTSCLEGEARIIGEKLSILAHSIGVILHSDDDELAHVLETKLKLDGLNIDAMSAKNMYSAITTAKRQGRPLCLLLGGETVVKVRGRGVGGRNQELALAAAIKLHDLKPRDAVITILSCGTDGGDGPCPAAGASINASTVADAKTQNVDAMKSLDDNDSYNFFKTVKNGLYHICTGHTGTNVMDIVVILIHKRSLFSKL